MPRGWRGGCEGALRERKLETAAAERPAGLGMPAEEFRLVFSGLAQEAGSTKML